ncbi:MAG: DUF1043 family protein [Rhodocyclaceae bacterium]|nr:DUF1043 family protein [Rhodocyclaceae bacterium]
MSQEHIIIAIAGAVVAIIIGFLIGRVTSEPKKNVTELEAEITRQKDEMASYKREVESHFDTTASLFVSMAGSYKDLFEHLSTDYEKLSDGSARELFRERVDALLLGQADDQKLLDHEGDAPADGAAAKPPADEPAPEATEKPDDVPQDEVSASANTPADVASSPDETASPGAAPTEDDVVPKAPANTVSH